MNMPQIVPSDFDDPLFRQLVRMLVALADAHPGYAADSGAKLHLAVETSLRLLAAGGLGIPGLDNPRTVTIMTRHFMLACTLVALWLAPWPASAQTVISNWDKWAVGLAEGNVWEAELDGIAATPEAIQYKLSDEGALLIRGLALRGTVVCRGAWFNPHALITLMPGDYWAVSLIRPVQGIDRVVWEGQRSHGVIAIEPGVGPDGGCR